MSKEEIKLALEALAVKFSEGWHEGIKIDASDIMLLNDAAQALAEQLAQQEPIKQGWDVDTLLDKPIPLKDFYEPAQQEPVAYGMWDTMLGKSNRMMMVRLDRGQDGCAVPLYTNPPQRKPLTHEQRVDLLAKFEPHKHEWHAPAILIDMVEAAHGIKGGRMSTKEWGVGYDEGYQQGWNDAMDEKPAEASEPVAYIEHHKAGDNLVWDNPGANSSALYTSPPPQRTWVGLTDEEMDDCWNKLFGTGNYNRRNVYRAIEAKLRSKNENRN